MVILQQHYSWASWRTEAAGGYSKYLKLQWPSCSNFSFSCTFCKIAHKLNEFHWRTLTEYQHRYLVSSSALAAHLASRHQLWAEHQSARGGWASRPSPGRGHRSPRPHRVWPLGTPHWWHSNATPCHISERIRQGERERVINGACIIKLFRKVTHILNNNTG